MPRQTGTVPLPDGRLLGYAEYGPADGSPVVFLAGAGCGRLASFGADLLDERHVRLISVDRPGLGVSSPHSAKTFASVAADVARLVDVVVGDPVPVVANSQGAPFGLAVAGTPAATAVVLVSPIDDVAHPAIRAQLPEGYRALLADVATDPGRAEAELSTVTADGLLDMVLRDHPNSDAPIYDDPAFREWYRAALHDGFRCGAAGYARDTVLAMTAWPDRLFAAGVPVTLLMGGDDRAHSPDGGRTLAERLSAAHTVVDGVGGSLPWARPGLVFDALERG